MKKIITLTFAVTILMLGAIGIQAQPNRKPIDNNFPAKSDNGYHKDKNDNRSSHNDGGYDFRGEGTFYTTEYVWKFGRQFENTYEVSFLRNGRTTKTLVKSVMVRKNHKARVSYKTETVKQGRNLYRVTYKITHFANGRKTKVVIKKVLINTKDYEKDRKNW